MNRILQLIFFSKYSAIICVALFTIACQGVSMHDIRSQQPYFEAHGNGSMSSALKCIIGNDRVSIFAGDRLQIINYPDGKASELAFGAIQMGNFKKYYLVSMSSLGNDGYDVVIRRSNYNFIPISESEMSTIISQCISAN